MKRAAAYRKVENFQLVQAYIILSHISDVVNRKYRSWLILERYFYGLGQLCQKTLKHHKRFINGFSTAHYTA